MMNETRKTEQAEEGVDSTVSTPQNVSIAAANTPTNTVTIDGKRGKIISFFVPEGNPNGMQRVDHITSPETPSPSHSSFKEMALKKIDDLQTPKNTKPSGKRRKVNPFGDIITSDEQFEVIQTEGLRKEQEEKEKKERKEKKKANEKERKEMKRKEPEGVKENEDGENLPLLAVTDDDDDDSDDDNFYDDGRPEKTEKVLFPPVNDLYAK